MSYSLVLMSTRIRKRVKLLLMWHLSSIQQVQWIAYFNMPNKPAIPLLNRRDSKINKSTSNLL